MIMNKNEGKLSIELTFIPVGESLADVNAKIKVKGLSSANIMNNQNTIIKAVKKALNETTTQMTVESMKRFLK